MKNISISHSDRNRTYTFGELITNLRPHYLQIRKDLNSLQEHITIQTPYKCNATIDFSMKNDAYQEPSDPRLFLRVYGKPKTYLPDMATFALNQNDGINVQLLREYSIRNYGKSTNEPVVSIEDTREVRELDEKIKTNPIFNLPFLPSTLLNSFQRLYISSSGIYLTENENSCDENLSLRYDPDFDKMLLVSMKPRTKDDINNVLETKIPNYVLHPSYYELMAKTGAEGNLTVVNDFKTKRANFAFDQEGKSLTLIHKK